MHRWSNGEIQAHVKSLLPTNYNFELEKIIWQIRKMDYSCVALQFPEGLLMYACTISDIIQQFSSAKTVILGDVTYGACCIDDFTAIALDCDFLVHFGHSCLVPIDITKIKTLYVFVDIQIDLDHFISTVIHNFKPQTLALVSTIQFVSSLHSAPSLLPNHSIIIPQSKPLSGGEILGCTAPKLAGIDSIIYLGDGRFHLEAVMIANPSIPAYRYDPYSKKLTIERYDHDEMKSVRRRAIQSAQSAQQWGVILGTLGRQGSTKVLDYIIDALLAKGCKVTIILLSEIFPGKLALFAGIDCFVQIACPRLSIDWGYAFDKPLLTPYECAIVLGKAACWDVKPSAADGDSIVATSGNEYPMDFYAKDSLGPWTPNHVAV